MVFTRTADETLAGLAGTIDRLVSRHAREGLAAIVAFVGPDRGALDDAIQQLQDQHDWQQMVLAVPRDHQRAHPRLRLHPDAAVTVVVYRDKRVAAVHSAREDEVTPQFIGRVTAEVERVVR